ncbi:FG-GAP repeat domain-containing protein [Actinokineospora inagensis]|uniref:FG-GAP repeat domain-containing protein n=1 Tax=Actinokineospora inagensis TaxID=103730 RepID=UPI00047957BF|nr:VCBS repeat-containing protein [Actinokineospora inagensis]
MRKLVAALSAVALTVLIPATATAGGNDEAVIGDITGDSLPDRITFGRAWDNNCMVVVEPGKPGGGYDWGQTYLYESPVSYEPYCASMGELVDLGGGVKELVTTNFWNDGDAGLVALRLENNAITVVGKYAGVPDPNFVQQADFTGDGRGDVWVYSDQYWRLRSFNTTSTGDLVPGSISECTGRAPQYVLADFDGDGGQDMLAALDCGTRSAKLLYGGNRPALTLGSISGSGPQFKVYLADNNGDQYPDVTVDTPQPDYSIVTKRYVNDGAGNFTPLP